MSTIKPSTVTTWATDANYTSGAESGLSTKLAPVGTNLTQGFVPGFEAPARWFNWLFNAVCAWIAYLNVLNTDDGFVGANFVWAGTHTFNGAVTVGADPTLGTPVSGAIAMPLTGGSFSQDQGNGPGYYLAGAAYLQGGTASPMYFSLSVRAPANSTLDKVFVGVRTGSDDVLKINILKTTHNYTTGANTTTTLNTGSNAVTLAADNSLHAVTVNLDAVETIDPTASYEVQINSGTALAAGHNATVNYIAPNITTNRVSSR